MSETADDSVIINILSQSHPWRFYGSNSWPDANPAGAMSDPAINRVRRFPTGGLRRARLRTRQNGSRPHKMDLYMRYDPKGQDWFS
jgi:hypothetical protein